MKYGVLYYKDTDNIGDDIQSYASARFIPKIDYYIDRENLESFSPNKKESVKCIMNSWYLHDKFNFDISPYIHPLYISMFFKKFPYEAGITIGNKYINENVIENFKKYGPIGTRDNHTANLLDEIGVKNKFSGCMTLTIEKFENLEKKDYIVTNGLTEKEINYIKSKTNREVINYIQDVERGSFSNETWEERMKRVEDTLKLYQQAHLVITTKLHCSLPCLALETPILLVYDRSFAENEDRIGTYLDYLNYVYREDLEKEEIDFEEPKSNPTKYLKLRKELEKNCEKFIKNDNQNEILPEIEEYDYYLKKSRNMRKLPIEELEKLQKKYENECEKSSIMYDELEKNKKNYQSLKEDHDKINYRYNKLMVVKIRKVIKKIIKGKNKK